MLTLTENASTIVKGITAQTPDATGIRISSESETEPAFAITPVAAPEAGDQVVEQDGATVFLDSPASAQLDDKILDAGVDESGAVQFAVGVVAPEAPGEA